MSRFMRRMNREEGFTLIELMIVIVILGILVGLAVPRLSGITGTAQQRTDEANRRILMSAASMWYAENAADSSAKWPQEWTATGGTKGSTEAWASYLQEWPVNPTGGSDYKVTIQKDGTITIDPSTGTTTGTGS